MRFWQLARNLALRSRSGQGGSIFILAALSAVVVIGIAGLAVDVSRLYAARAELSRSIDAAALAGVLEFNGTSQGLTNAQAKAQAYFNANEPTGTATITADGTTNKMSISAHKSIRLYFLALFGFTTGTVSKHAAAGFQDQTIDAAMVIDATPSMSGTSLTNAKTAAINFSNTLLGTSPSGNVVVGVVPFRGCYEPSPMPSSTAGHCIDNNTQVLGLSYNTTTITNSINNITGESCSGGCSATNVCTGLGKGYSVLQGAGNHTSKPKNRQYLVLLSDGDNYYYGSYTYQASPSSPDTTMVPTVSGTNYSCQPPNTCTNWGNPCHIGTFSGSGVSIASDNFDTTHNFSDGTGWSAASWTTSGAPTVVSTGTPQSGSYHAKLASTDTISRTLNLSAYSTASFTYYAKQAGSWGSSDHAYVEASTNGSTWTTLTTYSSSLSSSYSGSALSVSLASYAGQSTVYVRFRAGLTSGKSFYVDTISILNTDSTGYLNGTDGQNVLSCTEVPAPRERQLDVETLNLANAIKAQNVEIIVVAFGACNGGDTTIYSASTCASQANPVSSPPSSGQVGDSATEASGNERLLKCIASSTPGTNDHYYYAASATDLPNIFTTIAANIAHRLVE